MNDCGPYVEPKRRMIDLLRAAARRIGRLKPRLGLVRVVVKQGSKQSTNLVAQAPRSLKSLLSRIISDRSARIGPPAFGAHDGRLAQNLGAHATRLAPRRPCYWPPSLLELSTAATPAASWVGSMSWPGAAGSAAALPGEDGGELPPHAQSERGMERPRPAAPHFFEARESSRNPLPG